MAFNINGNNYLTIDASDLQEKLGIIRQALTEEQFKRLLYRTFNEVARKAKTMIAKDVQVDYAVTQAWVKSQIGSYSLTFGGEFPVTCSIPISGAKGVIGPRFKLSGRKRIISAKIVKSNTSTLPKKMENQGGFPPFIYNNVVFTRKTKRRLPIVRVVALGVPQMPLNRSADSVQTDILDYVGTRLEHHFMGMFGGGY